MKLVTDSSETIDPTGNGSSSEFLANIIAEMVTILGDEIVSIASVFFGQFFHHLLHFFIFHIRRSYQYCLPIHKPLAPFWFSFEYPRWWMLVCSKCILHSMHCITKNAVLNLLRFWNHHIVIIPTISWMSLQFIRPLWFFVYKMIFFLNNKLAYNLITCVVFYNLKV